MFGLGLDIGAYYNMNLLHTNQYENSIDGVPFQNDSKWTPYLRVSIEPFRGLFSYSRKGHKKNVTNITAL